MKMYHDTELDIFYTEAEMYLLYEENAADICESSGAATYAEWIRNCTSNNGFLEVVTDE